MSNLGFAGPRALFWFIAFVVLSSRGMDSIRLHYRCMVFVSLEYGPQGASAFAFRSDPVVCDILTKSEFLYVALAFRFVSCLLTYPLFRVFFQSDLVCVCVCFFFLVL